MDVFIAQYKANTGSHQKDQIKFMLFIVIRGYVNSAILLLLLHLVYIFQ